MEARLLKFISDQFASGATVTADTELLGQIIDSVDIFVLVEFIEQEFGVKLDDADLTTENLRDARAICGLVEALQQRSSEG